MESIGTILRLERERRGLGMQEVFESTRITIPNIEALEQDRFESFPNKVYARAFLRDYANFLDLDSVMLLQRYEAEWFSAPIIETLPNVPEKRSGISGWSWVSIIILVLLIAGGGYVFLNFYSGDMTQSNESITTPIIPNDSSVPQGSMPNTVENSTSLPVQPVENAPPADPKPDKPLTPTAAPAVTGLVLTITAVKTVWVRVIGDGKVLYASNIAAGQSKTWTARQKFNIRSGMLNAVQVKLNGVPMKLKPASKSRVPIGVAVFGLKDIKPAADSHKP